MGLLVFPALPAQSRRSERCTCSDRQHLRCHTPHFASHLPALLQQPQLARTHLCVHLAVYRTIMSPFLASDPYFSDQAVVTISSCGSLRSSYPCCLEAPAIRSDPQGQRSSSRFGATPVHLLMSLYIAAMSSPQIISFHVEPKTMSLLGDQTNSCCASTTYSVKQ